MFFSLFLASALSAFDPQEMQHTRNDICVDLKKENDGSFIVKKDMMSNDNYILRECNNLGTVKLEDGMTTIKEYMFYGSSITSIIGTNSLTSIGEGAFAYCTKLTTFAFGPDLATISEGAFCHSGLGSGSAPLTIGGNSLNSIGQYAFTGCPLKSATLRIPAKLDTATDYPSIGNYAFYRTGISTINLPQMEKIGDYAFSECSSLSITGNTINSDEIGDYAFYNTQVSGPITTLTSTSIGKEAFSESGLTFDTIKQKVTTIGGITTTSSIHIYPHAFSGRTITGPLNFASPNYGRNLIDASAFSGCIFKSNSKFEFHSTTIGSYAFSRANFANKRQLTLRDGSTLGEHAFEMTYGSLEIQTSDNGNDKDNLFDREKCHLVSIPSYAFYSSTAVTASSNELYITGEIGTKAFSNCTKLIGNLIINTKKIDSYAFSHCYGVTGININFNHFSTPPADPQIIGQGAFEFCNGTITQFKITASTDNNDLHPKVDIGRRAFYGSGIACELVIHRFVQNIHEYAFANCLGLSNQRITIYAHKIHPFAFADCNELKGGITTFSDEIQFHSFDNTIIGPLTIDIKAIEPLAKVDVQTEAFYAIQFTGKVIIKEKVVVSDSAFSYAKFDDDIIIDAESLGHAAFSPCHSSSQPNNIITLSIGNTKIGPNAFEYFGKDDQTIELKFHSLDSDSKEIGNYAFHEANIRGHLDVPFCFNRIGDYAFNNCSGIETTNIKFDSSSSGSNSIGRCSFQGCKFSYLSLKSNGAMTSIGYRAFFEVPITNELILPTSINTIGEQAFSCTSISGLLITHDSQVVNFGVESFCNCTYLSGEIFIPYKTVNIRSGAFSGCTSISKLTLILEGELRLIGDKAFYGCSNLAGSLDIPFRVEIIGNSAFANCTKIGEHLTFKYDRENTDKKYNCLIGDYAFYGCTKLKYLVQITDNDCYRIGSIGNNAFERTSLTGDLVIPNSIKIIGSYAFRGCTLGKLTINNKNSVLEIIGEGAFQNTAVSGNIVMPSSLRVIDNNAFENCRNLGSISFGFSGTPSEYNSLIIGSNAFSRSSISGNLIIPSNTILILDSAFEGCNQLTSLSFEDNGNRIKLIICDNAFKDCALTKELLLPYQLVNSLSTFNANSYLSKNFNNFDNYFYQIFNGLYDGTDYKEFGNIYERKFELQDDMKFSVGECAFSNCGSIERVHIKRGIFGKNVFQNCRNVKELKMEGGTLGEQNFIGCRNFNTITLYDSAIIGPNAFSNFQENSFTLKINSGNNVQFLERAFYNSTIYGPLILYPYTLKIGSEAFAECKYLNGSLSMSISSVNRNSFANSVFNGSLYVYQNSNDGINILGRYYDSIFKGSTGFTDLKVDGPSVIKPQTEIPDYAYSGMPIDTSVLIIGSNIKSIGKYAFQGCNFYQIQFLCSDFKVGEGAFSDCVNLNTTVDLRNWDLETVIGEKDGTDITIQEIPPRVFSGCSNLPSLLYDNEFEVDRIGNEAFARCSSLSFHLDLFLQPSLISIGKRAFYGCSNLRGSLEIPSNIYRIEEYAFAECTGLSDSLTIRVAPPAFSDKYNQKLHAYIGPCAFKGCDGFKKGKLYIFIEENEEDIYKGVKNLPMAPFYKYDYFLIIGNEAFEDTKFKDVYYNGRFQPDCDYDIGFSHTKGIHTSSNFVNKTFCNYPLHSSKLSGGAIAGITIAVLVVVAAIIILILFLIFRNKKKKDKSEDEVEMNADP